jgi:hypothetical protein
MVGTIIVFFTICGAQGAAQGAAMGAAQPQSLAHATSTADPTAITASKDATNFILNLLQSCKKRLVDPDTLSVNLDPYAALNLTQSSYYGKPWRPGILGSLF